MKTPREENKNSYNPFYLVEKIIIIFFSLRKNFFNLFLDIFFPLEDQLARRSERIFVVTNNERRQSSDRTKRL